VIDLISLYIASLDELGRTARTVETYTGVLRRMDRELPCGLLTASDEDLRSWIYIPGRSKATRALYRAVAVGFFGWATDPDETLLDYNPARRLPRVVVPRRAARAISDQQLVEIVDGARDPFRLWFTMAGYGGLRCIELSQLRREHVTEGELWIQGKGDKERLVPTHPRIWLAVRDRPRGPLVLDASGRPLDARQISSSGRRELIRMGHRGVAMHDLRRWFATATYEASGHDIRAVQELLGHSSVATTQRYVAAGQPSKAAAVAALPGWGGER
jgi:integrase/recombinase XerC